MKSIRSQRGTRKWKKMPSTERARISSHQKIKYWWKGKEAIMTVKNLFLMSNDVAEIKIFSAKTTQLLTTMSAWDFETRNRIYDEREVSFINVCNNTLEIYIKEAA